MDLDSGNAPLPGCLGISLRIALLCCCRSERRKLPPDMPVVAAFGSTVSHDPLALPFALGRPSLRRLSEPDAVPNLSASQAGLSRKARPAIAMIAGLSDINDRLCACALSFGSLVPKIVQRPAKCCRQTLSISVVYSWSILERELCLQHRFVIAAAILKG